DQLASYYNTESGGQLSVAVTFTDPVILRPPFSTDCAGIKAAAGSVGFASDYHMYVFAGVGIPSCTPNSEQLGSSEAFAVANDINMAHEFGHQLGLGHEQNCGPMSAVNTSYSSIAQLPHLCDDQKRLLGWQ